MQFLLAANGNTVSKELLEFFIFPRLVNLVLTKKQTKEVKAHQDLYRYLTKKYRYDFVDLDENSFYLLDFRVVRFQITETAYGCIITNLAAEDFPVEEIKKLDGVRWGIERSFRELKYMIGLANARNDQVLAGTDSAMCAGIESDTGGFGGIQYKDGKCDN